HKYLVKISRIYSDYFLNYNHIKNRFCRKLVLRKNSRFSVTFLGFFLTLLKTIGNCLLLTPPPPKYQLDSLSYQKQGSLFKIEALLVLQNVVTDTKINKKTHHCKINTFITSFRI
ncbi:Uncharacterized protein FWK35_00039220, partial [Aphis craccivora]